MNSMTRHLAPATIALITIRGATNLPAAERDSYVVTPLVSDLAGKAKFQDGVLRNSATNFRAGTIDVFGPPNAPGGLFTPAKTDGGFTDPQVPAGFAPLGAIASPV